jgi:hypothetical protein
MRADHTPKDAASAIVASTYLKRSKLLYLYLCYAVLVVAGAAWLGAFKAPPRIPVVSKANGNLGIKSGAAALGQGPQTALPNGVLVFDAERKKVKVAAGEVEAQFTFKLINAAKEAVTVERVETSCGCTVAKLPAVPWVLKPREDGEILVTMNLNGVVRSSIRDVAVFTSKGYKMLQVEAVVTSAEKPL